MSYERQRTTALRMVKQYGAAGTLTRTVNTSAPNAGWKPVPTKFTYPIYFVSFPDDGTVFIEHNIQGDVKVLTVVGANGAITIGVGDTITTVQNKVLQVREAKQLNPDETEAILWAALVL